MLRRSAIFGVFAARERRMFTLCQVFCLALYRVSEGKMAIEYRGFRIATDAKADATDTQWVCSAKIEGYAGEAQDVTLPPVELTIPKLKIDVLMALSAVEHRGKDIVDEWRAAHPALS
jgi:hypothetical protein